MKEPGWRGHQLHLLSRSRNRLRKSSPTTPPSVDEKSSGYDRRFECKLTQVCFTPAPLSLVKGHTSCIDALMVGSAMSKLVNVLDRFWNGAYADAVAQLVAGDRSP